jgi:hypothetical protein
MQLAPIYSATDNIGIQLPDPIANGLEWARSLSLPNHQPNKTEWALAPPASAFASFVVIFTSETV